MVNDNRKYSLNEIRNALSGVYDVKVLNDRIDSQSREIKLYREKITKLEELLEYENRQGDRIETMRLLREFEDDHKSFLTRPFSEYIDNKVLRNNYFQDWFCELVRWTEAENYVQLMNMPEAELMKYTGIGKARIKAIKDFGRAMETGWGLAVTNLFTGSPVKRL